MTVPDGTDPNSQGAAAGDELAVLRINVARFQHKLERDRRYLEFSRRLIRLYRDGDAARRRGEAAFRLPDFYVIGAPRCATTWLKIALSLHPDILMLRSEPSVFTYHLDNSPDAGLARYLPLKDNFVGSDNFETARYDRLLIGEKSPDYLTMGPSRLKFFLELNPDARFVLLCREPAERLWSHFLHQFADHPEYVAAMIGAASVTESTQANPRAWRFIERAQRFGFYRQHLGTWQALVPADRLLAVSFNDIVGAPAATLRLILGFIGADAGRFDDARLPPPQSTGMAIVPPAHLVDWMRDLYGDEPGFVASLSRFRPQEPGVSAPEPAEPAG